MGICAKTQHKESAPGQYEIAQMFDSANIATDHNQLILDTLHKVANRHSLACLLHEKPFAGVNGSGKHNNWSLSTDEGVNLLEPGNTPHENAQFLTFICAVIKAVDEYAELLRASAANAGNDHRLGAHEAPPAIISIFLGEELSDILEQLKNGKPNYSKQGGQLTVGVLTLPTLPKDSTDRNRTSPFAFTGNKFEFRMVPSSSSIADPNTVLNTIVAEILCQMADRLEKAPDFHQELSLILQEIAVNHSRVIFDGNGYSEDWVKEAQRRGLPNITSTVEAISALINKKTTALYEKHKVFSATELHARYEIYLEQYSKTINIEALTMIDVAKRQIFPTVMRYATELAHSINTIRLTDPNLDVSAQSSLLQKTSTLLNELNSFIDSLQGATTQAKQLHGDAYEQGIFYRDVVFQAMNELRNIVDQLEVLIDYEMWPLPSYTKMLFRLS